MLYIPNVRNLSLSAIVVLLALVTGVAVAPFCAALADQAAMPCCKDGKRCDLGIRASECCRVEPAPSTPRAAATLDATPRPDRHHDDAVLAPAADREVAPTSVLGRGRSAARGLSLARSAPLYLLNTTLLC